MPLQNFLSLSAPAISAAWLNLVDTLMFTVFNEATTKALARAAWKLDSINLGIVTGALPGDYVASLPFTGWTYTNSGLISMTPDFTNAGAATLNVGAIGAIPIVRPGGTPVVSGDLPINVPVILAFDNNADALVLISSTVVSPVASQNAVLSAGNNNDLALNPNVAFLEADTTAGAAVITGIVAQPNGSLITITNTGVNPLTLSALDALSLAANRFRLSGDLGLLQNDSFTFRYSTTLSLWVSIS